MWQKCPICNGTGTLMNSFGQVLKCETCNGTNIISEVSGLPPKRMNNLEPKQNMFDLAIESVRKDNPNWTPMMEAKGGFDMEEQSLKNALENESKCFNKKDMVSFAIQFSTIRMIGGTIEPYQELENWIKSQIK
jgi:hypothetical protein